ncbi:MAG TPA: tyrosine-type recombinase/integrase [Candidatus Limnocylindrales bacterium]|nr:tyrosine-type recombinase/integrase [Candidatus Limnocylindrales bacterium]
MVKSTARRRSPGEGTVYRRKDRPGWRGRITFTDATGKADARIVSGATEAEARAKLDEIRRKLRLGTLGAKDAGTVGTYLDEWIEGRRELVAPSTFRTHEGYVRGYLIPALGRIKLGALTGADVDRALASFMAAGRPRTAQDGRAPRPVSALTANHVRAVLRTALNDARRAEKVGRNAASDSKPRKERHHEVAYLEPEDLARFLSVTADDELGPLWALAAATGLRRGELLALRWDDVKDGNLSVRRAVSRNADGGWSAGQTKTERSRRTLPLPATARHALDRQRKRQARAKIAMGSGWQDREGRIFTDAAGRGLLPEYVSHVFGKARTRAGLPTATLHQLRHTAATLLLKEGVPIAVISSWLGHSGISVTMEHYAAIHPELQRNAADALDRALSGGAS